LECIAGEGNTKNQALKKIDEIRKDTGVEKKLYTYLKEWIKLMRIWKVKNNIQREREKKEEK
jgi:hypothetical protein